MISALPLIEAITRELVHRDKLHIENRLRVLIAKMLRKQGRELQERFIPRIDFLFLEANVPPAVLSIADAILSSTASIFEKDLISLLLVALEKGSARVVSEVPLAAGIAIPEVTAASLVRAQGGRLIAGVNSTTREIVRTIIADGLENHLSYQQVAAQLRKRFAQFTSLAGQGHIRDRAELIAVTEVANAYSLGQLHQGLQMAEVGIDVEKAWLSLDSACPICDGNAAEGWIEIEGSFSSGDDAPTAHPACRCALQMRAKA